MGLLDTLALDMGCEYLSDLKYIAWPDGVLSRVIKEVTFDAFPEEEWIEAAEYLCGIKCSDAKEAWKRLLGE